MNWTSTVYFPNVGNDTVLVIEAWRGQCELTIISAKPLDKNVTILVIPRGSTKYAEPLDVFMHRQWKDFVKKFKQLRTYKRI